MLIWQSASAMTHLPKIESTKMRHPGVGMIQDLVGYRLPLVSRILVSGWIPVTTCYQNLVFRVFTGFHWLPEFRSVRRLHPKNWGFKLTFLDLRVVCLPRSITFDDFTILFSYCKIPINWNIYKFIFFVLKSFNAFT